MKVKITSDGTRNGTRVHHVGEVPSELQGLIVQGVRWRISPSPDAKPECFLDYRVPVDAELEIEAQAEALTGEPPENYQLPENHPALQ